MTMSGMRSMSVGLSLALAAALVLPAGSLRAAEFDTEGVNPGRWTMDLEAAKKQAAGKKTVLLLNFSGSDWCGWCKLMEKDVFSQQAWRDYAAGNVAMVVIDFPQGKDIVPEKYVRRNEELKDTFDVEGFPTFVVLDSDGATELGRLSAGRDKTPESFIAELRALCRYRPAEVDAYAAGLNEEDAAAYRRMVAEIAAAHRIVREQKESLAAAGRKMEEAEGRIVALQESAADFRAARLGEEKLKEYRDIKEQLAEATKELQEWLAGKPQRSDENNRRYQEMQAKLQSLAARLGGF
jgi:thioredoxin-related protein